MDSEPREEVSELDGSRSSGVSPDIDSLVNEWQHTGVASLGDLSLDLQSRSFPYSESDIKMIYFILRAGHSAESQEFTVWTNSFSQGFAIAKRHPFLMQAVFAFTAFSLAFESGSVEAKGLAYQYGGVALQGLQDAISEFSAENADAVLLASRLLAWQANDWRSWASLTAGIRTVVDAMQNLPNESSVQSIVDQEAATIPQAFPESPRGSINEAYYAHYRAILSNCSAALDDLAGELEGRKHESRYIDQLRDYVHRLVGVRPAQTSEEQFNHLYTLRKWIFYVPAILLRNPNRDQLTLIVIAHFYAVALSMDDLFPSVAPVFLSSLAITPLKEIISALDAQAMSGHSTSWELNSFPRAILCAHLSKEKNKRDRTPGATTASTFEGFQQQLAYSLEPGLSGHRSPAFGQFPVSQTTPTYSSTSSGYLDVPIMTNSSSREYPYDAASLPAMSQSMEPEDMMYDMDPATELPGGFVASPSQALWT